VGQMIDAVDPANIPAGYNGALAVRVTVTGDPAGQVFDIEPGNPPAAAVWPGMAARLAAGHWAVAYVDQSTEGTVTEVLHAHGLEWSPAALWPEPGVYEWAADPSGNIAAGRWRPATTPLAVQDRYMGGYDLSTTVDHFPARVAGYIDGPVSKWPAGAWTRFVNLPDVAWVPSPAPANPSAPPTMTNVVPWRKRMFLANDGNAQYLVTTRADGGLVKCGLPGLADPNHPELAQLAAAVGNAGACPTFLAQLPAGPNA
jgi:hypothetical protein